MLTNRGPVRALIWERHDSVYEHQLCKYYLIHSWTSQRYYLHILIWNKVRTVVCSNCYSEIIFIWVSICSPPQRVSFSYGKLACQDNSENALLVCESGVLSFNFNSVTVGALIRNLTSWCCSFYTWKREGGEMENSLPSEKIYFKDKKCLTF